MAIIVNEAENCIRAHNAFTTPIV